MHRLKKKVARWMQPLRFENNSTIGIGLKDVAVAGVCAAALFAAFNFQGVEAAATKIYEDVSYALYPGPQKAYAFGERHFNGQDVHNYDIRRAEYFFREALTYDADMLYLHHQMARIYFLRGDFGDAMTQINAQIATHGDDTPNSYYVRGLIEGYMGDYASAADDYEYFLKFSPTNWAGINDYAWVLLKAERFEDAAKATEEGLKYFPDNPWLLNSSAIALYETGNLTLAHERAQKAWDAVQKVSEKEWLHSYPGNDPAIAGDGMTTFRTAVSDNMHRIELALASSTVQ